MEDKTPKFIVTEHPPWYLVSDYKDGFNCESTQGLFDKVANMMVCKQVNLSEREKSYKPKNIYKTIRSKVIRDADAIQQKPSRSLLLALMDLVDIEGGNDFESMASVDKAGLKHVLLAYSNYTTFYIPNKELISANGKKVIPVVTQYSEKHNLVYYDSSRSMIGTYTVVIPTTGKGNETLYFVQEVLFVPGLKSLNLLEEVTGNKFEFWDMTLEVPTHLTALTPSFQQIQPLQLLRTSDKSPCTQSNNDALVSRMEEIHPMCCVLGTALAEKKMREASVDHFTEDQVRCNLKHFHYKNGGTRTVYFRRSSKLLDGKRVNLVPVVALRKGQAEKPELYVSTTVRFCRAVKHCCVKGNGELVSCWNDTLNELERKTFITGTYMCQEIHNPALTAFIKRVNPNSWCNYIPKHVESMIMNPIMVEVVELAIKFMDNKIPNAFAVAELLYCPIEKVQECLKFWNIYSSDNIIHAAVNKNRISMVEEQMKIDWAALAQVASSYGRKRYGEDGNTEMVSKCEALFKHQTLANVAKTQKMWHALIKHDTSKIKDKELVQMYATAKVLFLKLRTYHNKVKKGLKVGESERGDRQSESSSSHSTEAQDADVSSKRMAEVEEGSEDEAMTGVGEKDDSLYPIITPESIPISTWIKNMSTLLLSEPWLTDDNLRREAVCTLLRLDDTLLNRRYGDILRDWVISNRTVVNILKIYGLQDRLSKALLDCLESTSTDNWRRKILLSFQGTCGQPRGGSDQLVAKPSNKMNPHAQSNKSDLPSKQHAARGGSYVWDRSASKSNKSSASKSSGSKSDKKARDSLAHSSRRRYSDNENLWLSEAEEVYSEEEGECHEDEDEIPGEELADTMEHDYSESPDEYDYSDEFIDDGPTEEEYSSEAEDEEAFCEQVKGRTKKAKCKTNNVKGMCKYKRLVQPDSEEDEEPSKSACSGMNEDIGGFKRVLQSDSEEELIKPDVKRVKRTNDNARSDTSEERSAKVVKETSVQHFDREDETRAKKKHKGKSDKRGVRRSRSAKAVKETSGAKKKHKGKSDKRCERVKPAKAKRTPNQSSPLYKGKLSDSETDDYEGEEKRGGGIKGINPSNIEHTRSPISSADSEQEERRPRKKTQKGRSDNTPRRKLEKREPKRSVEQEEALEKQELCAHPGATSSHQSPGVSRSQGRRLSGETSKAATLIDLQQEASDLEEEGEWDQLAREDHANHPADPTSAAESPEEEEEEDSDLELNF